MYIYSEVKWQAIMFYVYFLKYHLQQLKSVQ